MRNNLMREKPPKNLTVSQIMRSLKDHNMSQNERTILSKNTKNILKSKTPMMRKKTET
jgi:hypothetical protein